MPSITLIPGDGIGPEIVSSVRAVFSAMNIPLEINEAIAGGAALAEGLDLIPEETLTQIERSDATLKGPITTPIGRGFSSVNVSLRQHFNLFANVRPVLSLPGTKARFGGIDIIVVRENLEGLYSGIGHSVSEDGETAELKSVITRSGSERVIRHAFDTAQKLGRKKVTLVHKANIMKMGDGLFLECCKEVSKNYPNIGFEGQLFGDETKTGLWARTIKNTNSSTGQLARPFARLLAPLTRSLTPHHSLRSRAPLRLLVGQ